MTTGIEKIILREYNGFTVEISVKETYDILANTSDVSVGLRVKSDYESGVLYLSGFVKLDGKLLVEMDSTQSTHHVPIASRGQWYSVMGSTDKDKDSPWIMEKIFHNTNGSKNLSMELELRGYAEDNYLRVRVATIQNIQLTHIPRASSVGASDANIGAVSTLSVIRRSADYTHSISYRFGELSGYIRPDGTVTQSPVKLTETSIPFRLPESFYGQIPNSPTGTCFLTVRTYAGDTQIGDDQQTEFTVTAAKALCGPQIQGRVEDSNPKTVALTGNPNILVCYVSNALCTITATAKNGSEIVAKEIAGTQVAENTLTLEGVQMGTVAFGCTDSRGYGASLVVKKQLVPYLPLAVSVSANRTDPTSGNGRLTLTGNWFCGSFGAVENTLAVTYTVNGGTPVTAEVSTDGNTFQAECALTGLDYKKSHTIAVTVTDRLQTVTKSVSIGKGIPVFHWGEADFQFHVPVSLGDHILSDLADPVGENDAVRLGVLQAALSGKAPAGYGLGTHAVAIDSLNDAAAFGLTVSESGTPDGKLWTCLTIPYQANHATQIAWRAVMPEGPVLEARRQKYNRIWGDWVIQGEQGMVKLWENPDPAGSFGEQTVSLDLTGFQEVLIYFTLSATYPDYLLHIRCPIGKKAPVHFAWADDGISYHRTAVPKNREVAFYEGYRSGTTDNAACIPYQIYGIKGVAG